ncbi:MAG: NAD(P)-dependent oxidoreductase [Pirellula sp.]|jgi:2-hydroxy-3-oxopropionate reductase
MNNSLAGTKIGFVGLGNMGKPMAKHLHEAGANVMVWNRSIEPVEWAVAEGMQRANNLSELASWVSDGIACINLTNTDVVREVVFGEQGMIQHWNPEALLIDFGTTSVEATQAFGKRISWVDAPVSGGQVGAEAGTLSIMAGGSESNFARALPILNTVGKRVTHMGPTGSGQVTKLANQLIVAQTIDAVAQALRLAELAGVESGKVREALLGGFAESRILQLHGERMAKRDFRAGGRAELQLKDVRLICEMASAVGFQSPTLENCLSQWEELVETRGLGDVDHSGLFLLYE